MPSHDTEAQFKFLLCCIKHSAAGKVNFGAVAEELSIVSKAAAAKRYERLLKAHDISPSTPRKAKDGGNRNADNDDGEPKTPASKKRKRAPKSAAIVKDDDDDDDETPVKKEPDIKTEQDVKKEEQSDEDVKVKEETKVKPDEPDYISE